MAKVVITIEDVEGDVVIVSDPSPSELFEIARKGLKNLDAVTDSQALAMAVLTKIMDLKPEALRWHTGIVQ